MTISAYLKVQGISRPYEDLAKLKEIVNPYRLPPALRKAGEGLLQEQEPPIINY